jgi:hypothetical protein
MPFGEPLRHAVQTLRRGRRMLLVVALLDLLVCLPPTLHLLRRVHEDAANRPDALSLAHALDLDFAAELRGPVGALDSELTMLCAVSVGLFFLVRPLVLGGFVGVAATRRRVHLSQFLKDAGAVYWKFLRLAILGLAAYYLLAIAAKPLLAQVEEWAAVRSETTAQRYRLITNLVVLGAFGVVATILEYARIGIRLDRRPGILAHFWQAVLFVLQHPGRTLGLYLLYWVLEAAAIGGVGVVVQLADGGYYVTSAAVLLLFQLVVILREGARLFHVGCAWNIRAAEAGEDSGEEAAILVDREEGDLLRTTLPWNVR